MADSEYSTLRDELLQWQSRRFTTVGVTIAIVTALIGWVSQTHESLSWQLPSITVLLLTTGSCVLTWIGGVSSARIGTYLEVFHASDWERRARKWKSRRFTPSLNLVLAGVFAALAGTAVCVFVSTCGKPGAILTTVIFYAVAVVFAASLVLLALQRGKPGFAMLRLE